MMDTRDGEEANARSGTSVPQTKPARVFVALKVAPDIAQELAQIALPLERLSIHPIAAADIHLTLVPPWNESAIPDAVAKLGRVTEAHGAFVLDFQKVGYGPDRRRPRFLWAECAAGKELTQLRAVLLDAFGQKDERLFLPHVTLARLRNSGARVASKCPIDRALTFRQQVDAVQLMQSPPAGERGYRVLASAALNKALGPMA